MNKQTQQHMLSVVTYAQVLKWKLNNYIDNPICWKYTEKNKQINNIKNKTRPQGNITI